MRMMDWAFAVGIISVVLLLAVLVFGGGGEVEVEKGFVEEPTTEGLYIRFQPDFSNFTGVEIRIVGNKDARKGSYGFSFDNSVEAEDLPEGYFLPRVVDIYVIATDTHPTMEKYQVILGPGPTPRTPDNIIYVTLSEEFWVGPLKPDLTQVLWQ